MAPKSIPACSPKKDISTSLSSSIIWPSGVTIYFLPSWVTTLPLAIIKEDGSSFFNSSISLFFLILSATLSNPIASNTTLVTSLTALPAPCSNFDNPVPIPEVMSPMLYNPISPETYLLAKSCFLSCMYLLKKGRYCLENLLTDFTKEVLSLIKFCLVSNKFKPS